MWNRAALILLLSSAAAPPAQHRLKADYPELAFLYAWPAMPKLPRLEKTLTAAAEIARSKARQGAIESWRRDRSESGENPPRHDFELEWSQTASTVQLLALRADSQFYTGGAHEGIAYDSLIWDKRRDRAVKLGDLFAEPRLALAALEKDYCTQLKQDQRERRGDGFAEADFRCPAMARQPVILTGMGTVRGYTVLLQPYAAGSWAEGPYEVELRFKPASLRRVKAEYRASFSPAPPSSGRRQPQ